MAGRNYSRGERAALVALCQGTCYKPGCPEQSVMVEDGEWVLRLEIAHIRALEPGGPRYDPNFPDPDDFSNLIFLCNGHHKLIDQIKPAKYPVEVLLAWKAKREGPGLAALTGLRNLTEDRLQAMISESYSDIKEKLDDALERFAAIDSEAAALLRTLQNELLDALPPGSLLDLDAAAMIHSASRDLRGLPDTASSLTQAANDLKGLGDTADLLVDVASDLSTLPDTVAALHQVVEDMKRHRPEY